MNYNRIMAGVVAIFLVASMDGCATLTSHSRQSVAFFTTPPGAFVQVQKAGHPMSESSCETPCTISLDRKEKNYRVRIMKEGYQTYTLALERETNDWIWGNFTIVGLIVDLASGAWYRLTPGVLDETLTPVISSEIQSDDSLTLVIVELQSLKPEQQTLVTQGERIDLLAEPANIAR